MRKEPVKSPKFLITLPFWIGDRNQAMAMARLLADLEPKHSDKADLLLVNRFDCPPFDAVTVKYLSRKFNVLQHKSARRETGWPAGCNGLFFGTLEYVYHMLQARKLPQYKAILNLASDVVPLVKDWLEYFHYQWEFLPGNLRHPVYCAGHLIPGDHEHINGDIFLYSAEERFLKWLARDVGCVKVRAGWDWVLAPKFREWGWGNIAGVHSLWNTPTMPAAEAAKWRANGAVMIHGVKDNSLLRYARKALL